MADLLDSIINSSNDDIVDEENKILAPLLEEIRLIEDTTIASFVRSVLLQVPYFWDIPASFSGKYHPPDEAGVGGNVLHTKRVARTALLLASAQHRDRLEKDILLAAALLHDITKGQDRGDGEVTYDKMHAYTVDGMVEWIRTKDELNISDVKSSTVWIDHEVLNQILRLVRTHMGVWSPVPETIPLTSLEWMLHQADLIAANLHRIIDGEEPHLWRWFTPKGDDRP